MIKNYKNFKIGELGVWNDGDIRIIFKVIKIRSKVNSMTCKILFDKTKFHPFSDTIYLSLDDDSNGRIDYLEGQEAFLEII